MLYQKFNDICNFRKDVPLIDEDEKSIQYSSSSEIATHAKSLLNDFKVSLENKIGIKYKNIKLNYEISKGAGNFPLIWHICILTDGQKVSNGLYVAICFDKYGRGALIGCAESKTNSQGSDVVRRKIANCALNIDVDGASTSTKYNNVFINPKEFRTVKNDHELEEYTEKLIHHVKDSIDLTLFLLGQLDDIPNSTRGIVNSSYLEDESSNIDQDYLIRTIKARRGQSKFRRELLTAYRNTCAITECSLDEILEAAHIVPYAQEGISSSVINNGILLRADLHTLFDLNLIKINPDTLTVELNSILKNDETYSNYDGKKIALPSSEDQRPHKHYLEVKYACN